MLYCFKRRVLYELFKVAQQAFSSQIRTIVTTFSFKKGNYNHSRGHWQSFCWLAALYGFAFCKTATLRFRQKQVLLPQTEAFLLKA